MLLCAGIWTDRALNAGSRAHCPKPGARANCGTNEPHTSHLLGQRAASDPRRALPLDMAIRVMHLDILGGAGLAQLALQYKGGRRQTPAGAVRPSKRIERTVQCACPSTQRWKGGRATLLAADWLSGIKVRFFRAAHWLFSAAHQRVI